MKARLVCVTATLALVLAALPATVSARQIGQVQGIVTKRVDGAPVGNVRVTVEGTTIATVTAQNGRYSLLRVPVGDHVIVFRWLGFQPQQASVTVAADGVHTVDVALDPQTVSLSEIVVEGASRVPERIVEAPAAVAIVSPITLRDKAITGQAPRALTHQPGVDIVQSGMNDFNVNSRGFNSSLNRRVLVLQDGRDLAIAFLGSQEWNALSVPTDDFARMEMVRGPGSALYGANAFSGVIDIRTSPARDVTGTKITLGGGSKGTIRGDLRHAGVLGQGRFGYKVNVGYNRSESWSLSRTALDGSDAEQEYSVADEPVTTGVATCTGTVDCLAIETTPLAGQTRDPNTGLSSGTPDQLQNIYGSARLDYYLDNGSILTVDGGAAQVENELFVTGIGRVQVVKAIRPWARAAFAADKFNLTAWYSGRVSQDPQVSLSSGLDLEEKSAIYHVEGQYDESFLGDEFRVVLGASFRNYNVDTKGTLMNLDNDNRSDNYYSAYGQLEWVPLDILKVVAAGRVDDGDLFKTQFSPKGAIVLTPSPQHAIRATINSAFMLPNYSEFFLQVQAGASPNPGALEGAINGYYATVQDPNVVGQQLAVLMGQLGLPSQVGWNFETQTPVMALGNETLEPETVLGYELGYKGEFGRGYIGVDLYWNDLDNFVTDLLFGVNGAQYPDFDLTQPSDPAADLAAIDAVLAGVGLPADHALRAGNAALQDNLTTLQGTPITDVNGTPSVWLSYAQAGKATERGIEFSAGYGFTPEFRADVSYTFFDFEVKDPGLEQAGQAIVPNTPQNKATIALSYTGIQGFDAALAAKFIEAFDWNAGVFAGRIPSSQVVDLNVGYRFRSNFRVFAAATNLLDQQLFQLYGGSVNGLRVLGGVTASF